MPETRAVSSCLARFSYLDGGSGKPQFKELPQVFQPIVREIYGMSAAAEIEQWPDSIAEFASSSKDANGMMLECFSHALKNARVSGNKFPGKLARNKAALLKDFADFIVGNSLTVASLSIPSLLPMSLDLLLC